MTNSDEKPTFTKDQEFLDKQTSLDLPGAEIEFSPEEAEYLGAFAEDALSEEEAKESWIEEYQEG